MIQNLRRYADSWFFKGFLAIVTFCFVFLGVGDLIRSLVYDRPIAVVGSHTISMEEFDAAVRMELRRIQTIKKSQVTLKDLTEFGFIEKILERLIAQHLLAQELTRLGINASENLIRNNVRSLEPFMKDGQFDPTQYRSILKNVGISEQAFVKDIKKQIIEQQYFLSFSNASVLPDYYKQYLLKAMLQKRVFSTVFIETAKMPEPKSVTDEDLTSFYADHKDVYKQPESRDISVLNIDIASLAKKVEITADDLRSIYDARKDLYITPEKRLVKKIFVASEEDASKVKELLAKKTSLSNLKKTVSSVIVEDLGSVTKEELANDNSSVVFDLQEGVLSNPIPTEGGFCLYLVEKIEKQKQKSFDQVKVELEKEIRIERFQDDYKKFRNKLEDDLSGGTKLEDLAAEYKLNVVHLNGVKADGSSLSSDELKSFEKEIIDQAFQLMENNSSNVIDVSYDRAFVVFVKKIHPENIPEFSAIKNKVKKDYVLEQKHKDGAMLAQKIGKDVKNVAMLADFATKNRLTLKTNNTFSRLSLAEDKKLQENGYIGIYDRAFSMPINKAIAAPVKDGFLVVMPEKDLIEENFDEEKKELLLKRFEAIMHESMANILVEALKNNYNVEIKTERLNAYIKMATKE